MEKVCPICKKELKIWYSGCGGKNILGCSDIKCNYLGVEINE
jgi:ssDNA-binding Zn-finger/Zn-ribbon topoisomerase 1